MLVTPPAANSHAAAAAAASSPKKKLPPKTVTKTVHTLPPSLKDLARLRAELEKSDPLPTHNEGAETNDVPNRISSTQTLIDQYTDVVTTVKKEYDALQEAYDSFNQRFDQDTVVVAAAVRGESLEQQASQTKTLQRKLASLISLLKRSDLIDLSRENVTEVFRSATDDLKWLLLNDGGGGGEEEEGAGLFLRNEEGILTKALTGGGVKSGDSSEGCQRLYLELKGKKKMSNEFDVPPQSTIAKKSIASSESKHHISKDTARESDLYEYVDNIKNILSRRDLSSLKLQEDELIPSPLSDEGTDILRAEVALMAKSLEKKWQGNKAQVDQMKKQLEETVKALLSGDTPVASEDDNSMCASSELVEKLVSGGLEALRRKGDLHSSLASTVFASLVDNSQAEEMKDKIHTLAEQMKSIGVPTIDFDKKKDEQHTVASSKIVGKSARHSFLYLVDTPLLHKGVVGWVDSFVETISGYNDHVDSMLDWIIGDSGETLGTTLANGCLKVAGMIPFPYEHVGHLRKAGILGGRTRSLLDE